MKENKELEIKRIVNSIEIASDDIIKHLHIDDESIAALRMIKDTIPAIHAIVKCASPFEIDKYEPVLLRVLDYLQSIVRYPAAIEFYADRIQSNVENYLQIGRTYDAKYEDDRDKEIGTFIDVKRAITSIVELTENKKRLLDQQIDSGYSLDSFESKLIETKVYRIDNEIEYKKASLEPLRKIIEANTLIRNQYERAITLSNASSQIMAPLEEFSAMAYENREKELELDGMLRAYKDVAADVGMKVNDFDSYERVFKKEIEETILGRMYNENPEEYNDKIERMRENELTLAIAQLVGRIDGLEQALEKAEGEEKKNTEQVHQILSTLLARTEDVAAFRDDVSGDFEKEVEYCLMRTPADIQSAQTKIRNCIERYCRYKKGVDLNDKIFFTDENKVVDKLKVAGIPDNLITPLAGIYKKTQSFVHFDEKAEIISEEAEKEVEIIRQNVAKLKKWGINNFNVKDGMPLFYIKRNNMLKEWIDEKKIDVDSKQFNKQLPFFIDRNASLKEFMEKKGIVVPEVETFNSRDDVDKYIREKLNASLAKDVGRRTGIITMYSATNAKGMIDKRIQFSLSDCTNMKGITLGAKVSYIPVKDKNAEKATKIVAVPREERV